jgi:hypothetical protein
VRLCMIVPFSVSHTLQVVSPLPETARVVSAKAVAKSIQLDSGKQGQVVSQT